MEFTHVDIRGVARGWCKEGNCDCDKYARSMVLVGYGRPWHWCDYCGHAPAVHARVGETAQEHDRPIESEPSHPVQIKQECDDVLHTICGSEDEPPSSLMKRPANMCEIANIYSNRYYSDYVPSSMSDEESLMDMSGPPSQNWPHDLPPFSPILKKFLEGESEPQMCRHMENLMRDEVIAYLDNNRYIENDNPGQNRWQYHALGHSLLMKYPKVQWTEPEKKAYKNKLRPPTPWAYFMRRVTVSRKAKRCRMRHRFMATLTEDYIH